MAIMATHPTATATTPGTALGPPTPALLGVPDGVVATVMELASVVGVGVVVELSVSDLLVEVVVFLVALVFVVVVEAAVMVVVPVLVVDSVLPLVPLPVPLSTSSAFLMLNPGEYWKTDSSELSTIMMPYCFSSPSDFLTCHLYLRSELSMPANLNSVSRAGVK